MKLEYLVENKNSIVLKNLTNGNVTLCKSAQGLKGFLIDSLYTRPIIEITEMFNTEVMGNWYKRIVEYETEDTKIIFADAITKEYGEIFKTLNTKRLSDMFVITKDDILKGINTIKIEVSPYSDRLNKCGVFIEDDEFLYKTFKNISGNISNDEILYMKKIVDIFLRENDLSIASKPLAGLGIVVGKNDKRLIGLGEPIETIVNRKVLSYGKRI